MLDSLRALMLKSSPPPDDPPHQLQQAQQALEQAEQYLAHTRATTSEKLAERQVAQRKDELAAAELALKGQELAELQAQLAEALAEKTTLHHRIKHTMEVLLPDLQALDALEVSGRTLNDKAFALSMEIPGAPRRSSWRDAKLSGAAMLVKTWLQRLEG